MRQFAPIFVEPRSLNARSITVSGATSTSAVDYAGFRAENADTRQHQLAALAVTQHGVKASKLDPRVDASDFRIIGNRRGRLTLDFAFEKESTPYR